MTPKAQGGEDVNLGLLGDSSGRPTMNEQDQRAIDRASRQVVNLLVAGIDDVVFCDGSHDGSGDLNSRVKFFIIQWNDSCPLSYILPSG